MTWTLRIVLLAVSALTFLWVIRSVRKSKSKIRDSLFWILFSALLVTISVFPSLVTLGTRLTGVMTESNFIFLVMIFILIVKSFRMSLRISQLESKLQQFAQAYAIAQKENVRDE